MDEPRDGRRDPRRSIDLADALVGSVGNACDKALAETINGLYKAGLIHRRALWKSREAVEPATLEWGSWFNHHRLLEPIGCVPAAETEAAYYRQLAKSATTGGLKPTSLRNFRGGSGDFA